MKTFFVTIFLTTGFFAVAQSPVAWSYKAMKTGTNSYEVHVTATIPEGWHLYAQQQPKDAIALPTVISFRQNPLLVFTGKPREDGKLQKITSPGLGISAWQYTGTVDFVEQVKRKAAVKTTINGMIQFQVCTDEKCLPQTKQAFSIAIGD